MKKIVLFVAMIFFSISFIHAQFGWGVKGGLTAAKINLDLQDNLSADFTYGAHGGVFFKFGEGTVSFQPEVMFIQKGVHLNDDLSEDYAETKMNYLEVPLLARTSIDLKAVEVYFHFGGYGSYLLSSKETLKFNEEQNGDSYQVDECNDFDAGVIFGAGVKVLSLVFEVRYGHGLANVCKNSEKYQESKNQTMNISLGVQF
jgi:hypothetical protein